LAPAAGLGDKAVAGDAFVPRGVGLASTFGLKDAVGRDEGDGLAGGLIGRPAATARLASVAGSLVLLLELTGVSISALLHDGKKIIGISARMSNLRIAASAAESARRQSRQE
jgi:hypothetical protein